MTIPLIVFFLLTINSIIKSRLLYIFSLFIIIVFIGFRGVNVGVDTLAYEEMYEYIGKGGYQWYPEPLFGILMYYFYRLGFSYLIFQIFLAITTTYFFSKALKKCSVDIYKSLLFIFLLYFFFYAMNISRQILAVSIVLYAYTFLNIGRNKKFVFYVLIATLIHYASIISLGILVVRNIKFSKKFVSVCVILSLLIGFFLNDSVLSMLLGPYAHYLTSDANGARVGIRILMALALAIYFSFLCLLITYTIRKTYLDNLWYKIYLCGIILNNLTMRLELGLRIVMFFSIVQVIVYVMYIYKNRIKQKILISQLILIFLTIYFLVFFLSGSAGVIPYEFYFQLF